MNVCAKQATSRRNEVLKSREAWVMTQRDTRFPESERETESESESESESDDTEGHKVAWKGTLTHIDLDVINSFAS